MGSFKKFLNSQFSILNKKSKSMLFSLLNDENIDTETKNSIISILKNRKKFPGNQVLSNADVMSNVSTISESFSSSYVRSIGDQLSQARIPITEEITKILDAKSKMIECYHATSIEYLDNTIKIQKSTNQISAFTHGLANLMNNISVYPDILLELKGKAMIQFDHDIISHPDKNGIRWLSTDGSDKSKFLQEAIKLKIVKDMLNILEINDDPYNYLNPEKFLEIFDNMSSTSQSKIATSYILHLESILKKQMYIKIVKNILNINKRDSKYNEIILSNFKILGAYVLEAGRFQFNRDTAEKDIISKHIKYLGFISKQDFKKI